MFFEFSLFTLFMFSTNDASGNGISQNKLIYVLFSFFLQRYFYTPNEKYISLPCNLAVGVEEPGVGLVELPLDNALLVLHARLREPCGVHGHDGGDIPVITGP